MADPQHNDDFSICNQLRLDCWRPVVGYEGLYEVSVTGKIRRIRNKRMLAGHYNEKRYRKVKLSKDGVSMTKFVHRIVMEAFEGPVPDGHSGEP